MPGTTIRDALAVDLIDGNAEELLWTGPIGFELVGDGSTANYAVTVQGADDSAMSVNVVDLVSFVDADASETKFISTYLDKRYVQVSVDSGTVGEAVLTPVMPHDRRVRATTTS